MTPDDFIAEARRWVGTPFRHQGRVKGIGADCIGLIYGVGTVLGLARTPLPGYGREPVGDMLPDELGQASELERVTDLEPGDIMVFRFKAYPQHVGLWTGSTLIHSYEPVRGVVEHTLSQKWRRRHVATFRIKALWPS